MKCPKCGGDMTPDEVDARTLQVLHRVCDDADCDGEVNS
jgi:hypothetical protein